MDRHKLLAVDIALLGITVVTVGGVALAYHNPAKLVLSVWSCGGNYHGLAEFVRHFEQRHNCRVHYTAAPVEFLLERAVFTSDQPDILVGRSGPGWLALGKVGKIERGPTFFAADPYVILVAPGNPCNVRDLADLGRPGLRVVISRHAMRPKGKCAAHLMEAASQKFHPGLVERWENNAGELGEFKCGRELTDPIISGQADAAIAYLSVAMYPGARGKVETVAVDPRYIKAMTACKATVGQCICILRGSRNPDLASSFHDELVGEYGRHVLEQHGYLHITSPAVEPYKFLLRGVQVPARMPAWQVHLADRLAASGVHREALRRYLTAIHGFGPGAHDAYCRYRVGELLADQGQPARAVAQWRLLLRQFPRPSPQEYSNRAFDLVEVGPEVTSAPEKYWVSLAKQRLAQAAASGVAETGDALPAWVPTARMALPVVTEGDPGKNGTREFALAQDLFLAGDYEFAIRSYLKVLVLCYPSRHMPAASYGLGLCQWMRGDFGRAQRQWQQTLHDFPGTEAAHDAAVALAALPDGQTGQKTAALAPLPAWQPAYDTWPERGMTYGVALYEQGLPRFAFKEMVKLIQGEYGPTSLKPRARYQAGLAALGFGRPGAAALEWRLCLRDYPNSPWARRSEAALKALITAGQLTKGGLANPLPAPPRKSKPNCRQRLNIANEFFDAGLIDDEETVLEYLKALTVTRASPGGYDQTVVPQAEARLAQCLRRRTSAAARPDHRRPVE